MAPVERISSVDFTSDDFMTVVREVCKKRGLIREDDGGDLLTDKQLTVFTIGVSEEEAVVVACLGNEEMRNEDGLRVQRRNMGTEERPHILIAPKDIVDGVNLEIAKRKEAAKFTTAGPTT